MGRWSHGHRLANGQNLDAVHANRSYQIYCAADDVHLGAEFSHDLDSWLPADMLTIDPGSIGIDTVAAGIAGEHPRGFFRLRVIEK